MKNIAKLTIFFTLSFLILFIASVFIRILSTWIDLVRIIPVAVMPGEDAAMAAWRAFPGALYISILLTLSYTVRRNMPAVMAIICIWILGAAFATAASVGINRLESLKPAIRSPASLQGKPGLILSRSENAMILLRESSVVRGPRVVSIPGQPLIYQEVPVGPNNTILSLPALPFTEDTPWFIKSLSLDFSICASEMESRLSSGFKAFAFYTFSIIMLLGSLRFILELSQWPLANLFLGALIFRLILALDIFLNSRQINALIFSFLKERIPSNMLTALIFCVLSVLVIFYTLMVSLARPGRNDD